MARSVWHGFVLMTLVGLAACSSEGVRRSTYDALYQKQCIDQTGTPNCERDHPSYDEYQRDRDVVLQGR